MNELKCIKIIKKNNNLFLIEVHKDNSIRKVLIEDKYKEILLNALIMVSLHL